MTRDELRRARRAFVQAQHPDRGGDPVVFTAGLARFDRALRAVERPGGLHGPPAAQTDGRAVRVTVLRRPRGVQGWVRYLLAPVVRPRRAARVH